MLLHCCNNEYFCFLFYVVTFFTFTCLFSFRLYHGVYPSKHSEALSTDCYCIMATDLVDVCCINIRSLSDAKIDSLKIDIVPNFDIICLTETNLPHANVSSLDLPGFQSILRKDRVGRQGGGVGIYAANYIGVTRMYQLESPELELMWVNVKAGNNKVLLGVCYRPPNSAANFWSKLQENIDIIKQSGFTDIILAGDFNADPSTRDGSKLQYFSNSSNMFLHVSEPTRITPSSAKILDQFISNCPEIMSDISVLDPISTCDHCPIKATLKFKNKFKKKVTYFRHIWLYDKANFSSFRDKLMSIDWNCCFITDDPSIAASKWTELFMKTAKDTIPNKTVLIRPNDKRFYNSSLRRLRNRKNRLHRRAKSRNTVGSWNEFREVRNEYNNLIADLKLKFEAKQIESLKDTNLKPKRWWNIASSVLNRKNVSSYPPLLIGSDLITENYEKAEKFNAYFTSFSSQNTADVPPPGDHDLTAVLSDIIVSEEEVHDLIKSIKTGKSTGPDSVSPTLLKQAGHTIVPSLTKLFNLSLSKCVFPQDWKEANVIPLHKKNDMSEISNYRPVSLLSCTSKLFERAIFKHVFNFLRVNDKISLQQSGFIPGDSTVFQLAHLYHLFAQALDKQQDIRVVFCDVSKAFDRVWHSGLISKLHKCGIQGNLLSWFKSYLRDRRQRVVIEGQESSWLPITSGVPQGSVLGPLLFLVYINDITTVVNSPIRLFADDTTLYTIVDNPIATAEVLNRDLTSMEQWANKWLLKFSPSKTESLYISMKKKNINKPTLKLNEIAIKEIESHKHLGITLSTDLSWNKHINDLAVSANRILDVLNAFKYKLDRKSLERLYFTYVRSKLEYGSIVWDNLPKYLSDLLEDVQARAARIICGATINTSRSMIYKELGWETLQERRKIQRLVTMYKIQNGIAPSYLCNSLPEPHETGYTLRNNDLLPTFRSRINIFQKSFFPRTINDWNLLSSDIRNSSSLYSFKLKLKDIKHKPPDWFYHGERKWSMIHSRLRLLCSELNDHLFSHLHVIDDPSCPCGNGRETAKHFLLECPLFTNERTIMLSDINSIGIPPSLSNLLYGCDKYSVELNVKLFESVQNFLKSSERFA